MSLAQVTALVVGHLGGFGLPEPAALDVILALLDGPKVRVQVMAQGMAETAAALRAWVETLPEVSVQCWYPSSGHSVHLEVNASLTGPDGSVALMVYGGVPWDETAFAGLEPGQTRPLSLGQLTTWAGSVAAGGTWEVW